MGESEDRIERQIDIDAPAERVWELISRPGWYINEGTIVDLRTERRVDVDVVHHPTFGTFPIHTVELDRPRYAAFRWTPEPEGHDPALGQTLVEFWIDERPGGVTLRVAESGFATLSPDAAARRAALEDNTNGWEKELAVAKVYVESGGAP